MHDRNAPRRFPPPWRAERIPAGWLVVDSAGTKLAYIYGADPRSQTSQSGSLNEAQAETVAATIAALPEILRRELPAAGRLRGPCRVDEREGYFRVVDSEGYSIATIYCDDPRAGDLTWDEARRIAANIAKLAELRP